LDFPRNELGGFSESVLEDGSVFAHNGTVFDFLVGVKVRLEFVSEEFVGQNSVHFIVESEFLDVEDFFGF